MSDQDDFNLFLNSATDEQEATEVQPIPQVPSEVVNPFSQNDNADCGQPIDAHEKETEQMPLEASLAPPEVISFIENIRTINDPSALGDQPGPSRKNETLKRRHRPEINDKKPMKGKRKRVYQSMLETSLEQLTMEINTRREIEKAFGKYMKNSRRVQVSLKAQLDVKTREAQRLWQENKELFAYVEVFYPDSVDKEDFPATFPPSQPEDDV